MSNKGKDRFPNDFILGTSTSAFQIEGEGLTEWQGFRGGDGTLLGKGIGHYSRFKDDLEYILYLGDAYRFSMDWSKLQKEPCGELDKEAVRHYSLIFDTLKQNGKKVFLVLNHFANPMWMYKAGCWANKESIRYFFDYAKRILKVFGDQVDILNTFNEPNAFVNLAYLLATFRPKRINLFLRRIAFSHMAKAHKLIYQYVKESYPHIITGISQAHMLTRILGKYDMAGRIVKRFFDRVMHEPMHEKFLDYGKYADYIGCSYYGRLPIERLPLLPYQGKGEKRYDELGISHDNMWELYPRGIYKQIEFFHKKYGKPVIICENGTCTDDDGLRKSSLYNHLKYVKKALDDGLPVLGYFHWSTFDNFELAHGPSRRFGLTSVNFKSGKYERKIKPSGHYYHDVASSRIIKKA